MKPVHELDHELIGAFYVRCSDVSVFKIDGWMSGRYPEDEFADLLVDVDSYARITAVLAYFLSPEADGVFPLEERRQGPCWFLYRAVLRLTRRIGINRLHQELMGWFLRHRTRLRNYNNHPLGRYALELLAESSEPPSDFWIRILKEPTAVELLPNPSEVPRRCDFRWTPVRWRIAAMRALDRHWPANLELYMPRLPEWCRERPTIWKQFWGHPETRRLLVKHLSLAFMRREGWACDFYDQWRQELSPDERIALDRELLAAA